MVAVSSQRRLTPTKLEPYWNHGPRLNRALKHESPLARGGFRIAGAGFEPATFGL